MIHLRIVAPEKEAHQALEILFGSPAVLNVVHLHAAAKKPDGDVILCDVAREEASVIIGDLKELEIPRVGSIAVEHIEISLSDAADAAEKAAPGLPSDAVVWEEVEQRTSENTELSISFVAFMVLAMQIGAVGILLDQPILIVGAMVVGPEFGPLAGLSVALVQRRADLARRSLAALGVGFPVGIVLACLATLVFEAIGASPDDFVPSDHQLTAFISKPGFFSFFVAFVAGTVGNPVADQRQVGSSDRGPDFGDDDPGGVQHRRGCRVWRLERGRRGGGPARHQPHLDRARRRAHPVHPAPLLRGPAREAPQRSEPRGGGAARGPKRPPPLAATTARPRCRFWCARARSPHR